MYGILYFLSFIFSLRAQIVVKLLFAAARLSIGANFTSTYTSRCSPVMSLTSGVLQGTTKLLLDDRPYVFFCSSKTVDLL